MGHPDNPHFIDPSALRTARFPDDVMTLQGEVSRFRPSSSFEGFRVHDIYRSSEINGKDSARRTLRVDSKDARISRTLDFRTGGDCDTVLIHEPDPTSNIRRINMNHSWVELGVLNPFGISLAKGRYGLEPNSVAQIEFSTDQTSTQFPLRLRPDVLDATKKAFSELRSRGMPDPSALVQMALAFEVLGITQEKPQQPTLFQI